MKPSTRPSRRTGSWRRSARPALLVLVVVFALLVSGIDPVGGLRNLFRPDVAEAAVPTSATDETMVPHYFGPYPNWANSPQTLADAMVKISVGTPTPVSFGNPLIERRYATDYAQRSAARTRPGRARPRAAPRRHVERLPELEPGHAGGSPTTSAGGAFHALVLRPTGTPGLHRRLHQPQAHRAHPDHRHRRGCRPTHSRPVAVQKDDVIGFYGQGVPVDTEVPPTATR